MFLPNLLVIDFDENLESSQHLCNCLSFKILMELLVYKGKNFFAFLANHNKLRVLKP